MVPHAGPDSEVFRAVTALGRTLETLTPVTGSVREPARAALVYDWESWWAVERDSQPSSLVRYRQEALDWYSAFLALGVRVDVVTTTADLTGYDFVAAPVLNVVPLELAARLDAYVRGGGHLATTYYSGVVDENDHVHLGGYPGALRDLLGIRIEEFGPLLEDAEVRLDNGLTGTLWTDRIDVTVPDEVTVLARFETGDQAGRPAVTRRAPEGGGSAAYVSTRLGSHGLPEVLRPLLSGAGVLSELPAEVRGLVELTVRTDGSQAYWFLVNRTDEPVAFGAVAAEVLSGPAPADGEASSCPPAGSPCSAWRRAARPSRTHPCNRAERRRHPARVPWRRTVSRAPGRRPSGGRRFTDRLRDDAMMKRFNSGSRSSDGLLWGNLPWSHRFRPDRCKAAA